MPGQWRDISKDCRSPRNQHLQSPADHRSREKEAHNEPGGATKRTYCDRCKKEIINTPIMNAISRKMATYEIIPHYSGPGIKTDLCDECQTKVDNLLHDFFANREPKTGHWIDDKCSVCGKGTQDLIASPEWYRDEEPNFCPFCGIRLVNSQSKSEEVCYR